MARDQLKRNGFRILSHDSQSIPEELREYLYDVRSKPDAVRFLVTFEPIATWPREIQRAYQDSKTGLFVLPHPATRLYSGVVAYQQLSLSKFSAQPRLRSEEALQLPLARSFSNFAAVVGKQNQGAQNVSNIKGRWCLGSR